MDWQHTVGDIKIAPFTEILAEMHTSGKAILKQIFFAF
jgi:hypothetical protein